MPKCGSAYQIVSSRKDALRVLLLLCVLAAQSLVVAHFDQHTSGVHDPACVTCNYAGTIIGGLPVLTLLVVVLVKGIQSLPERSLPIMAVALTTPPNRGPPILS